jgi:5-(carboxyamino)imidazole ribonucleotide mutase
MASQVFSCWNPLKGAHCCEKKSALTRTLTPQCLNFTGDITVCTDAAHLSQHVSQKDLVESGQQERQERYMANPIVSIIMGSRSDLETMQRGADVLKELGVPYEIRIVSAHRTPDAMFRFAEQAAGRGIEVIIAGAGGAAHLPGMVAAKTILPVIGVPVNATPLNGMDSLLSIVQMPRGVPVATVAIGTPGATNAGLLAAQIVGLKRPEIQQRLTERREKAAAEVLANSEVEV